VRPRTTSPVGRRGFLTLAGGLAAAGGLATGRRFAGDASAGAQNQTIWFLDPEHGMAPPGTACPIPHEGPPTCHGCKACHAHAENKLFSSAAAVSLAHLNCKCLVDSMAVTEREYVLFFGPVAGPLHRDQFDRRTDQVFLPTK